MEENKSNDKELKAKTTENKVQIWSRDHLGCLAQNINTKAYRQHKH